MKNVNRKNTGTFLLKFYCFSDFKREMDPTKGGGHSGGEAGKHTWTATRRTVINGVEVDSRTESGTFGETCRIVGMYFNLALMVRIPN